MQNNKYSETFTAILAIGIFCAFVLYSDINGKPGYQYIFGSPTNTPSPTATPDPIVLARSKLRTIQKICLDPKTQEYSETRLKTCQGGNSWNFDPSTYIKDPCHKLIQIPYSVQNYMKAYNVEVVPPGSPCDTKMSIDLMPTTHSDSGGWYVSTYGPLVLEFCDGTSITLTIRGAETDHSRNSASMESNYFEVAEDGIKKTLDTLWNPGK